MITYAAAVGGGFFLILAVIVFVFCYRRTGAQPREYKDAVMSDAYPKHNSWVGDLNIAMQTLPKKPKKNVKKNLCVAAYAHEVSQITFYYATILINKFLRQAKRVN
jgi:hypothetical protein